MTENDTFLAEKNNADLAGDGPNGSGGAFTDPAAWKQPAAVLSGGSAIPPPIVSDPEEQNFWNRKTLPPRLSVTTIPRIIREFVVKMARELQVFPEAVLITVLALISAAVIKTFSVRIRANDHYAEPLMLYTLLIASSNERKSSVQRRIFAPIIQYEAAERQEKESELLAVIQTRKKLEDEKKRMERRLTRVKSDDEKQKIEEAIQKKEEKLAGLKEPLIPELTVENVTIECLARILAEQGGITLISDEACDILTHISQGMYKNTDIGPYLKGYTGEPCKIHRKTSGTDRIQSCRLTMALATQPRPAETFCSNPEMREKGLLSRFLFVPVPDYGRRIVLSEPCPYQVEADFNERIISLLKMRNGTGEIYLDEEAIYVYNNFFYRIEDRLAEGKDLRTAEMKSWAGRCQGKALRIAALIHCLEHPEGPATVEISGDTMQEAVTLIEAYFLPAAQFMLEDKGNQEIYDIKRVYEFIRSRNGSVKKMDITYGLKGTDLNAKRIDVALKELTDAGLILTQVTPTAGRPLTTFWAAGQSGDTDR